MAKDMFLYWGSGSPPCWQVMLALEEKELRGYGQKELNFVKNEHKSEEVLKLNPRGQLPTFRHGDLIINESMALCQYLESVFSGQGTKLIPDDPASMARVLQIAHEAYNLHKNTVLLLRYHFHTKKEDHDPEEIKPRKESFLKELEYWEAYFNKLEDGSHVAGKEYSLADVVFFPRLALLVRTGLPPARFPRLASYHDMVSERPQVKATWPHHWVGTEKLTYFTDI